MKKILVFVLAVSSLITPRVNGQVSTYLGGGIGVGRYHGEIGYHDYLMMVPVSRTSRPSVSLLGGLQLGEFVQLELNSNVQGYAGSNLYSSIPDIKKYLEGEVYGTSVQIGGNLMLKIKKWPFIKIGGGAFLSYNSYTTEGNWAKDNSEYMLQGTSLAAIASVRLKKMRYNDQLELRYRLLYNLNDNMEGKKFGVMGDHIAELQLVYLIPTRFIPMKMKGSAIRRPSRRGSSECPTF